MQKRNNGKFSNYLLLVYFFNKILNIYCICLFLYNKPFTKNKMPIFLFILNLSNHKKKLPTNNYGQLSFI